MTVSMNEGLAGRPRAVIFDDDPFVLHFLTVFLSTRGYAVAASDGPHLPCRSAAAERAGCPEQAACCDLLLTDVVMPGANGVDELERLAAIGCPLDPRNRAAMSGNIRDGERERLQRLGCEFFAKPFSLVDLSRWIAGCESRCRKRHSDTRLLRP